MDRRPEETRVGAIACVGVFDGVHRGHQAVVEAACTWARSEGVPALALTFAVHPDRVLRGEEPKLLLSLPRRVARLHALGAAAVVLLPFDQEMAAMAPETFARRVLREACGIAGVVVGPDFRFGRGAAGDAETLRALGFAVRVAPAVEHEGEPVSSSRIRAAVEQGDLEAAAAMLGRPFQLFGEVVLGQRRGQQLGFPTANLCPETRLRPAPGVYVTVFQREDGTRLPSVTNVGVCPTFGPGAPLTVESHVLDFHGELYGEQVALTFLQRLRPEKRFPSPAALAAQIGRDVEAARRFFAARPALTESPLRL